MSDKTDLNGRHRLTLIMKDRGPLKENGRFDSRKRFSFQGDVDTAGQMRKYFEMAFPDFESPPHLRKEKSGNERSQRADSEVDATPPYWHSVLTGEDS